MDDTAAPARAGAYSRLSGLRGAQGDGARGRIGPARGNDLACRVELNALGSVGVEVAEERALPAAEGVPGNRHRDRHVDPDHADVDVELELARGPAVAR